MILPGTDPQALAQAAQCLRDGGLVGMPTETVYGLAADACQPGAVAQIFQSKGRPSDHPLIVHVVGVEQVGFWVSEVSDFARRLMAAFWPGPLTLILLRRAGVAEQAAGGQATLGLRCPSHPVAQALLQQALALGVRGVAAPSANRFGRVSPTTAAHVVQELGHDLLVLDGGACAVGIESTIVDCSRGMPALLRPGMLPMQALSAAAGQTVWPMGSAAQAAHDLSGASVHGLSHAMPAPKVSGTLAAHYAPRATVRLLSLAQMWDRHHARSLPPGSSCAVWSRQPIAGPGLQHHPMPSDPALAAQVLFACLRQWDDDGVAEIWVEPPPCDPAWDGVRDRLQRAAAAAPVQQLDSR